MQRHDFLRQLHTHARPRTYLEVGVADGHSLNLARVPSIGVDPGFRITFEVECDLKLVRATSDDFFARDGALDHFRGTPIDLAFIDGMHLFEYALRDFINVERSSTWTSVIVLDDMLPRSVNEAARHRKVLEWAGDVYKLIAVLRRYRPDLLVVPVDTAPTGVVVVLGADPSSTILRDNYDEIVAEHVTLDPQEVPASVLDRTDAADPERLGAPAVWSLLVEARADGRPRDEQCFAQIGALLGSRRPGPVERPEEVEWPKPKATSAQQPLAPLFSRRRVVEAMRWRTRRLKRQLRSRR